MINRIATVFLFLLASLVSPQAHAALITINGNGVFGSVDASNPVYQPNAPFAFFFQVENPLDDNPTYNLVNASYSVNGVSVATPIVAQFFTAGDGGLFALGFDNGGSLSLSGPDIGSTGFVTGGSYVGAVYGSAHDYGSASVSVGAVPLPSSMALFGGGIVLVVVCQTRRRMRGLGTSEQGG